MKDYTQKYQYEEIIKKKDKTIKTFMIGWVIMAVLFFVFYGFNAYQQEKSITSNQFTINLLNDYEVVLAEYQNRTAVTYTPSIMYNLEKEFSHYYTE